MMEITFGDICKADGLSAEAAEQLEECVRVLGQSIAKNRMLDLYADGTVPVGECTERVPDGLVSEPVCPWGAVAVQSVVERSRFDGWAFPDPESKAAVDMRAIWQSQSMGSGYSRALKSGITYGTAFLTVGRRDGGRDPILRWHTAKTATGLWDMGEGRLECGMAVVRTVRSGYGGSQVPSQVDLYTAGGVWELTANADLSRWSASFLPDPMGEPRMLAMPFMPDDENPLGHTRLSAAVRGIIREYIANALNLHVASTLYAIGQKAIMGLTKEQFAALKDSKSGLALESIILGMMDKDGNSPRLDQWQQQSMEPLISVKRSLAQDFAAAASVPVSELISQDSNPTSAEALAASKDKLISLVETVNDANRCVLRKAALMMMAVAGNGGLDGLTEEQLSVSAHMRNPATPSMAALADSSLKMAQAIDGYAETDVCLERLGFDEGERYRIQAQQRRRQARLGASAILDRNRQVAADEGDVG